MLKKLNVGGYLNVLAALLGLAGTILTIVSGMVSADNPLANTALIAVAGFGGVALCLLAILAHTTGKDRWDLDGAVLEKTAVFRLDAEELTCKVHP